VSADGKYLVMERFGEIYLLAPDLQSPQLIKFNLYTDYRFNPVVHKTYRNNLESFALSPDGKKTAFQLRGDVFVKENNKEQSRSVNLSQHSYRDRDLTWLNNESLLFASDRSGQYDLYFTRSADPNKPDLFKSLKRDLLKITKSVEDETEPVVSPDGQKVVFYRGKTKFILARINKSGKLSEEKILLEGWNLPRQVQWSPDSRWLAYSRTDLDFNEEIFIQNIENGEEPVNISMHPREDKNPRWSPDGSKLGFISNRNNGDEDVWFVWLKQSDWEKTLQDREEGLYFETETEEKDSVKAAESKIKSKTLVIDLENIHHRLQQVTSLPGSETRFAISKDGETFYYTASNPVILGKSDLYSISYNRRNPRQLTRDGQNPMDLQPDKDGKYLYYLKQGGYLQRLDLKTSKLENLPLNAEMVIDAPAEQAQLFAEACSQVQQGFYDPGYHGRNFDSLVRDFRPLCLNASTKRDFRDMFNFMLGQLNASHMGLYGSDEGSTANEKSGHTGLEVKPQKEGVEIIRILPESPADKSLSKLNPGELILSVNGIKVTPVVNFNSLFLQKADKQVLLEVKDNRGKTREVVIRPVSSLRKQEYDAWVQEKRDLVDRYSNGRLGYIHIAGMDWQSFERFERELTASGYGKEGILIDVRFNGGGWTTDYLMTVLNVKQHAYTIPRNAAESLEKQHQDFQAHYPFGERLPYAAWTKPSIALCNSSSYSNAEIFSHAFQSLGLGKLIGEPTFGAVISTGAYHLMDGSMVRMPFRAWYVKKTGLNMEGTPAMPDILVQNPPNVRSIGEDPQLQKAVETLLDSIGQN
jgi:C-terminal processing protease CtpA/Prc